MNLNDRVVKLPMSMFVHAVKVFQGEYFVGIKPRTIVDVGANIGLFALYAAWMWPDAELTCYEPCQSNFDLLKHNTAGMNAKLIRAAVTPGTSTRLYHGATNCGECSLYRGVEQIDEYEEVPIMHPDELPAACLLKLDVEGEEFSILNKILLDKYMAVVLEYHSDADVQRICDLFPHAPGVFPVGQDRGIIKYVA